MVEFRCWDRDDADESDARAFRDWTASAAAERFAESRYSDDYPDERSVCVRCPDGVLKCFRVEARPSVEFNACEVE